MKQWIVYWASPVTGKRIIVGKISKKRMGEILRTFSYSEREIHEVLAEGEFDGLFKPIGMAIEFERPVGRS